MRPLTKFREGLVYYWPGKAQKQSLPPVHARLLCVRGQKRKGDVWLLTNVVSAEELSLSDASRFYRWRWENEGYFRTSKRTLAKMKWMCRTVREVHREAEASMIATQLLLAQGARALPKAEGEGEPRVMCSPRKVLLDIRRELSGRLGSGKGKFSDRLRPCCRERRKRSSPKATRSWPRRKAHKPPGPPKLVKRTAAQKHLIFRIEKGAWPHNRWRGWIGPWAACHAANGRWQFGRLLVFGFWRYRTAVGGSGRRAVPAATRPWGASSPNCEFTAGWKSQLVWMAPLRARHPSPPDRLAPGGSKERWLFSCPAGSLCESVCLSCFSSGTAGGRYFNLGGWGASGKTVAAGGPTQGGKNTGREGTG